MIFVVVNSIAHEVIILIFVVVKTIAIILMFVVITALNIYCCLKLIQPY